jgi:hypothetical protein
MRIRVKPLVPNSFYFKIKGQKNITYLADKIINDTIDGTPNGEKYYIITCTLDGREYQDEATQSVVNEKISSGIWLVKSADRP